MLGSACVQWNGFRVCVRESVFCVSLCVRLSVHVCVSVCALVSLCVYVCGYIIIFFICVSVCVIYVLSVWLRSGVALLGGGVVFDCLHSSTTPPPHYLCLAYKVRDRLLFGEKSLWKNNKCWSHFSSLSLFVPSECDACGFLCYSVILFHVSPTHTVCW